MIDRGIASGSAVGVLARNSRWLGLSLSALAKAGADAVLLNTGFAAPQLADVVQREKMRAVIVDAEFGPAVAGLPASVPRIVAWQDGDAGPAVAGRGRVPRGSGPGRWKLASRPERRGRQVLLTSGTTGTPKGAERDVGGPEPGAALLSAIPLRARQTTYIASPIFHAWGLSHLAIGLLLSSTIVLRRRFDPEETLRLVQQHGVHALVVVPVMLPRLLDLPEPVRRRYDLSTLRVVAVSGAALPAELALRFMDAFGDVVYNLYGTTEVAYASVAGPADLRAAPGTAGRPLPGHGRAHRGRAGARAARGEVGRIFVGNSMPFSGYTSGEDKERLGSLVSTGDLGYLDSKGRLFVVGRSDDMIVSGGENVFPAEVEDLLAAHPGVVEAAVVGVPDEQMGQRLLAFVVPRDPALTEADCGRTCAPSWPTTRCRARCASSMRCPATRPARSSSGSWWRPDRPSGGRPDGRAARTRQFSNRVGSAGGPADSFMASRGSSASEARQCSRASASDQSPVRSPARISGTCSIALVAGPTPGRRPCRPG